MRIYAFVSSYPSAYKPYLDVQFADLLQRGHDLRIHALERLDRVVGEEVRQAGLLKRTHYVVPTELRQVPAHVPRALRSVLLDPGERLRSLRRLDLTDARLRDRLKDVVRSLALPLEAPDLCLVHGVRVLYLFRWLRDLYPEVPLALYYHGGEPVGSGTVTERAVTAAFAAADIVFTNTRAAARELAGRGCPDRLISVLPVGFDTRSYRRRSGSRSRSSHPLRLVSIGRLTPGKGHRYAVEAIRRMVAGGRDRIRYVIVGDGPERGSLVRTVRDAGLTDRVEFRGTLPHQEVLEELDRAHALVHPSVATDSWAETQAVVVQEAMLMEAAVVTTRTGGVPESIPDGMGAFSVPERDVPALTAALERLYDLSDEELERLGREGRSFVEAHYEISFLNDRLIERSLEAGTGASA